MIFISHKLGEVLAIADRVVALRQGRVVAEFPSGGIDRAGLATLMVGKETEGASLAPGRPGPVQMRLAGVSLPGEGHAQGLKDVSLDLRCGQTTWLAGVSGNGQGALADLMGGVRRPAKGRLEVAGEPVTGWSPRAAIAAGVARIPEDRHRNGSIAEFDLSENVNLERYRSAPYRRHGWLNWTRARTKAADIIAEYDVPCPSPEARIRLLSEGTMQKLILGRALEGAPRVIIANQPVRDIDIGAVNAVHRCLVAARDAGVAVLLVSEGIN